MAIGTAIQSGSFVRVYDEQGRQLTTVAGELYGFTGSTVSVKVGSFIRIYDEHGRQLSTRPC